jgi:hypothetical protein
MSSRGRPRNADKPTVRDKDAVIARSAAILIAWGFARRTVYAELAPLARELLDRTDHKGKTLSAERIEQIHEEWQKPFDADAEEHDYLRGFSGGAFTKESKVGRRHAVAVESAAGSLTFSRELNDLARTLFKNKGEIPKTKHSEYIDPLTDETVVRYVEDIPGSADLELTPKALADAAPIPRMRKRGR